MEYAPPVAAVAADLLTTRAGSLERPARGIQPDVAALEEKGIADLYNVFQSVEWKDLSTADAERELPFMMHLQVAERECMIRGRMDALVVGQLPRIVDYKYANWQQDVAVADDP